MIDDPRLVGILMAKLKETLPIDASIAKHLATALAEKSPDIGALEKCRVTDVIYGGDVAGILCCLDVGDQPRKRRI